ncbi:hypothetical protein [Streptomyces fulvoviolaceus]|uniref:hypothetical protein n=1 Tax=Streptomyces fulvoviolaceus TaxID=285535 RepID=UPI003B830323
MTRPAPADRLHPVVDLGGHLRRGANVIEVEVATPLINRLRVSQRAVFGVSARQAYGLMRPGTAGAVRPGRGAGMT